MSRRQIQRSTILSHINKVIAIKGNDAFISVLLNNEIIKQANMNHFT